MGSYRICKTQSLKKKKIGKVKGRWGERTLQNLKENDA
jgi:hypothetical protein